MASDRNEQFAIAASSTDFVIKSTNQTAMASLAKLTKDLDTLDKKTKWIEQNVKGKSAAEINKLAENGVQQPLNVSDTTPYLHETTVDTAQQDSMSVQEQITTKKGKLVKAIVKDDKVIPARGANEINRGRQAGAHRKALTVSKGKVVNIYLENEFEVAADKVVALTGDDKLEWFKRVINSNSTLNPTAALRLDIVRELLKMLHFYNKID
jgi:hypothetical protein